MHNSIDMLVVRSKGEKETTGERLERVMGRVLWIRKRDVKDMDEVTLIMSAASISSTLYYNDDNTITMIKCNEKITSNFCFMAFDLLK